MSTRILIIAVICSLLVGCKPEEQRSQTVDNMVNIRAEPVTSMKYKVPVKVTGMLTTTTQMKLSFKTGGIVRQLNFREGESVRRKDVLAVLDLSEIEARVNEARIGYEKARRDLSRAENLYHDSVATLEQYQNARSALDLSVLQKQIVEFNLKHSRIIAPSDGKIQKLLIEANEMIAPGYPAILFASTENDWVVRVSLTDKDIVKCSMGDSAVVTMDAFPGKVFKAEITEMGTVADPFTGTYEAELLILQTLPQFRTGFFSRVEIYPTGVSSSLTVPLQSLLDARDHSAWVYVVENGSATKRRIGTGMILDQTIAVTEGLQEGELVVTDGARYINEDSKVNLVDDSEQFAK